MLWFLLLTLNGVHPQPVKAFWEDALSCARVQMAWQQRGYKAECIELPQHPLLPLKE
jgi:hypothetical protein